MLASNLSHGPSEKLYPVECQLNKKLAKRNSNKKQSNWHWNLHGESQSETPGELFQDGSSNSAYITTFFIKGQNAVSQVKPCIAALCSARAVDLLL